MVVVAMLLCETVFSEIVATQSLMCPEFPHRDHLKRKHESKEHYLTLSVSVLQLFVGI